MFTDAECRQIIKSEIERIEKYDLNLTVYVGIFWGNWIPDCF